jgi:hypothetical protein
MPKNGEFENRDRDEATDLSGVPLAGMGELPEDLSDERGDLNTYQLRAAEQMAPDMASAQRGRLDAAETGVGSPKIDYSVRSIFDSRPINSREFNLWFTAEGNDATPVDITVFRKCFFVPSGYVAVLRGVTVLVGPAITPPFTNYDGLLRIAVGGSVVDPPDVEVGPEVGAPGTLLTQLEIPFQTNQEVETFVIADESETVGVFLNIGGESAEADNLQVGFRGAFLLKTGVPAQFQAANEAGRARVAVTSSAADLSNIASGEGVVAKRRRRVPFANVPILRK